LRRLLLSSHTLGARSRLESSNDFPRAHGQRTLLRAIDEICAKIALRSRSETDPKSLETNAKLASEPESSRNSPATRGCRFEVGRSRGLSAACVRRLSSRGLAERPVRLPSIGQPSVTPLAPPPVMRRHHDPWGARGLGFGERDSRASATSCPALSSRA